MHILQQKHDYGSIVCEDNKDEDDHGSFNYGDDNENDEEDDLGLSKPLAQPTVQTSCHHQYQKLCTIHTRIHNQMNHFRHYKVHKSLDKREWR